MVFLVTNIPQYDLYLNITYALHINTYHNE